MSPLRLHLTGRIAIEGASTVDQSALPGRQGRLALVYLALERHRPIALHELAEALWGQALPRSWEPSLRVVISKLRALLVEAGGPETTIISDGGCYHLVMGDAWVDLEVAANALDRAEGAWRQDDLAAAWSEATVAASILRRPLLPGEGLRWVEAKRLGLRDRAVRALDLLVRIHLAQGEYVIAVAVGRDLVALEPYREESHRHLMRGYLAADGRAEAVRVHEALRTLLAEDLGLDPSPATTALYLDALRIGSGQPMRVPRVRARV